MKHRAVLCTVLAASLLTTPFAMAQGDSQYLNKNYEQRQRGYGYGHDQRGERGERGAGPEHSYYRGERMLPQYRTRQYVVEDWRGHRLSAPPRGYQWVQSGSDYVLVAIATGVILNLLLNNN
jgi:Ni/Co efflux regulator RcnB